MPYFGNITQRGKHTELDNAGNGHLETNTWHGFRYSIAEAKNAPKRETYLHDKQWAHHFDVDGWAPVPVIVGNRHPASIPKGLLVVFEFDPNNQPYPGSATSWADYKQYEEAWHEIIRRRCSWQHQQPVANLLLKMLLRRAWGDTKVSPRRIDQKFNELERTGCEPALLLAMQLTFAHRMDGSKINDALRGLFARAA